MHILFTYGPKKEHGNAIHEYSSSYGSISLKYISSKKNTSDQIIPKSKLKSYKIQQNQEYKM